MLLKSEGKGQTVCEHSSLREAERQLGRPLVRVLVATSSRSGSDRLKPLKSLALLAVWRVEAAQRVCRPEAGSEFVRYIHSPVGSNVSARSSPTNLLTKYRVYRPHPARDVWFAD
jgi:hypothetical protein